MTSLILRGLEPSPTQRAESSPLTPSARQRFANALDYAADKRLTLPPITSLWPSVSMSDAYLIQRLLEIRKETQGARVKGYKIGMLAGQNREMLGMTETTSGPIFAHQLRRTGDRLSLSSQIKPWLEAEIGLLLGQDVSAPATAVDVLAATRAVVPIIEVLDTRMTWKIHSKDSIADLASSGLVYLGAPVQMPSATALSLLTVAVTANDITLRSGHASAIGGVAHAAATLVNDLGSRGHHAKAGDLLLTGSFCAATPIPRGSVLKASFGGLGEVSLRTI